MRTRGVSNSHSRPGCSIPLWMALILAAGGYVLGLTTEPRPPEPLPRVAIHVISGDCAHAEAMARRYGWQGDWREYMWQVNRLNDWQAWPIVHAGDRVFVPDYRHDGRGRGQSSHHLASSRAAAPPSGKRP